MKSNFERKLRDLSVEERKELATHYIESTIQPNHYVHIGYLHSDGKFDSLLIDVHKKEAKSMKLKKSNDELRLMWWFGYKKK